MGRGCSPENRSDELLAPWFAPVEIRASDGLFLGGDLLLLLDGDARVGTRLGELCLGGRKGETTGGLFSGFDLGGDRLGRRGSGIWLDGAGLPSGIEFVAGRSLGGEPEANPGSGSLDPVRLRRRFEDEGVVDVVDVVGGVDGVDAAGAFFVLGVNEKRLPSLLSMIEAFGDCEETRYNELF